MSGYNSRVTSDGDAMTEFGLGLGGEKPASGAGQSASVVVVAVVSLTHGKREWE